MSGGSSYANASNVTEHASEAEQTAARLTTIGWADRHSLDAAEADELLDMLGLARATQ